MTKAKRQQAQRAGGTGQGGSFLVRLRPAAGKPWQGHITHVQSGREAYFRDLDGMLGFIQERLGEGPHVDGPSR